MNCQLAAMMYKTPFTPHLNVHITCREAVGTFQKAWEERKSEMAELSVIDLPEGDVFRTAYVFKDKVKIPYKKAMKGYISNPNGNLTLIPEHWREHSGEGVYDYAILSFDSEKRIDVSEEIHRILNKT